MAPTAKANWLIPAGLIALSIIPAVAGSSRLIELGSGAAITPDNARFFAAPLPVVLHIISVIIFSLLGAFQFSRSLRRRKPKWHRMTGRVLVPCGLVAAISGLWMSHFYPWPEFDGKFLYVIRLVVGSAMVLSLCLGFAAIRRRDIANHQAWMMRGYALGLGAGTQVLTHLPWLIFPSIHGELARTLFMAAGWAINLAVAEWFISRERRRRLSASPVYAG
jgi:uncharacterized membrane protein